MRRALSLLAIVVAIAALPSIARAADAPATQPAFSPTSFQPAGPAIDLFHGKDLTGWVHSADNQKAIWSVKDGAIHCLGKPAGYIRTEKEYDNYHLHVEWRQIKTGNSGVLLQMTGQDKVWPRSIECQGQYQAAGDIWNIDAVKMTLDPKRTSGRRTGKMNPTNEKKAGPDGEWNSYDLYLVEHKLFVVVNGLLQNWATDVEPGPGRICLQSEGAEILFRVVRLTPLKTAGK